MPVQTVIRTCLLPVLKIEDVKKVERCMRDVKQNVLKNKQTNKQTNKQNIFILWFSLQ